MRFGGIALAFICMFVMVMVVAPAQSQAACSTPTAAAGDLFFNSSSKLMQYCNDYNWVQIGGGPKGGSGCTGAVGTAGQIMFNSNFRVMQHCNGQEWQAWGRQGGIGTYTGACAGPTGKSGDLMFNSAYRVMEYCDGATWEWAGALIPSLSMDFAANNYKLSGTSYGSLTAFLTAAGGTFSRASTATYFDSTGTMQTAATGAARLDYDPVTHIAKGIMIEEAATNLLIQSAAVDNAAWLKGAVTVTADVATAPDGTMTADSVAAVGGSFAYFGQNASWSAGAIVTRSIYVKPVSSTYILFEQKVANTLTYTAFIVTGAGTVQSQGAGTTGRIQYIGNGWYRLSATRTFTAASSGTDQFSVIYVDSPGSAVAGDYAYFWGGQFEIGSFPTSYIPTGAATVTRAQDRLTMPTGSWYNPAGGTLVTQAIRPYMGGTDWGGTASIDDNGGGNNAIHLYFADPMGDQGSSEIWSGGVSQFSYTGSSAYIGGNSTKLGVTFTANNAYASVDGNISAQDTSVTLPAVTTLRVGSARGTDPLQGWMQGVQYYPGIMPPVRLQRMTVP